MRDSVARRVEDWLNTELWLCEDGEIVVAVCYASVWGISWLSSHSKGRPVTLFIGDMRPQRFRKRTSAGAFEATKFVRRSDVTIRNWFSDERNPPHLKVWAIRDSKGR